MPREDTAHRILAIVRRRAPLSGAAIAAALGISRQAVHRHLGKLLDDGKLLREGRTRGVLYVLPTAGARPPAVVAYRRTLRIAGLQEDAARDQAAAELDLLRRLSRAAYRIFSYAFTEMVNNAIEHSHSATCAVEVSLSARELRAVIRDLGVGVFRSVAGRMGLKDETEAIGELLKGKATTLPDRHSGEGIFFTSRACDRFALRSHRIELILGARATGGVVNVKRALRGTEVSFGISRSTRRELAVVFAEFSPDAYDFRFEKSVVTVRLASADYVSRSEARRLLARLEEFREVVLNFSGVRSIGQAFADEIFRVFRASHPRTRLSYVNLAPALEAVVRHVVDNRNEPPLTTG